MKDCGYLKISNEQDRITVAATLVKNGYTVGVVRKKKGSKFEYLIRYETKPLTVTEEDV